MPAQNFVFAIRYRRDFPHKTDVAYQQYEGLAAVNQPFDWVKLSGHGLFGLRLAARGLA